MKKERGRIYFWLVREKGERVRFIIEAWGRLLSNLSGCGERGCNNEAFHTGGQG